MSYCASLVLLAVLAWLPAPALAGKSAPADAVSASASVGDAKVNINTADVKVLMKLEGVGRSLAEKIVKYRDEHGQFKKPEDLRKVDGVGGGLWEKNRERVVVK